MKYTYKQKVKMAQKLKVFLAIFFAATIFFTGKVILDKTFAADNDYGTATITFNSGTGGSFEGGNTTNTVTYNLTKKTFKTSHTPNLSDDGTQNGDIPEYISYNDIVTIPGATSIHVKVVYGGGPSDYFSLIRGSSPNANHYAGQNLGLDTFSGYIHTYAGATREYDIDGNTVTFTYESLSNYNRQDGYGYYAIVSGETDNGDLALGSIASGEYKEPIGNGDYAFTNWDQELMFLNSNTTVGATYQDKIAGGTSYQLPWILKANGELILGRENENTYFRSYNSMIQTSYAWNNYRNYIKKVKFVGTVNMYNQMDSMFSGCPILTEVDFTNCNTTNVLSWYLLFNNCLKLESVNFASIDTSNVTNMGGVFSNCRSLTTINLNQLDTSSVTNISSIFASCFNLRSVDLTSLDTSNVTDMSWMFYNCYKLTSIDLTSFNTSNVTTMANMFTGCNSLTSIDLTPLDTSSVTTMYGMFENCYGLLSIDLTPLDTSNVTTMREMFNSCRNLTSIDLTPLDTSNVTNMRDLFIDCNKLSNINFTNFDTSNVESMSNMFKACESLETLDLSNFNTSNTWEMYDMFTEATKLKTITFGENFVFSNDTNLPGSWKKLNSNPSIVLAGEDFYTIYNNSNISGTYVKVDSCFAVLYDNGDMFFQKGNQARNTNQSIVGVYEINEEEDDFYSPEQVPWNSQRENVIRVFFNSDIIKPISTSYWFFGMKNLTYMDSFQKILNYSLITYLDTSETTNMECMFAECEKLKNLDLSGLKTHNVANMNSMFANCISLQEILFYNCKEISGGPMSFSGNSDIKATLMNDYEESTQDFDTINVGDMGYMFYNCKSLRTLNLSTFHENSNNDYYGGPTSYNNNGNKVKFLDYNNKAKFLSDGECEPNSIYFDTGGVYTMEGMFSGCERLRSLDISGFDTNFVAIMSDMFSGTIGLKELKLGENFSFVEETGLSKSWQRDGAGTVYSASQLQQIYEGSTMAGTYKSEDLICAIVYSNGEMVFQEGNLPDPTKGTALDIYTGFEDEYYTWETHAPWHDHGTIIDKIIFTTEIVPISTAHWFEDLYSLDEIENIEYLNTMYVQAMNGMFLNCSSLNNLDVSTFDTSNVTSMDYMFRGCESLVILDLSSWDTTSMCGMSSMFYDCMRLSILDLSSFDCSTKEAIYGGVVPSLNEAFFNTPELRVLALGEKFAFNNSLSNLAGAWQRDGNNTVYRAEELELHYDGSTMAGIYRRTTPPIPYVIIYDSGTMVFQLGDDIDPSLGNVVTTYTDFERSLVLPWADYNKESITRVIFADEMFPISTGYWFEGFSNLTEIENIEYLITSHTNNMNYMFKGCSSLTELDLSNFNTSKVTNMSGMFENCNNLINLDLSSFNTSNVTEMNFMFKRCKRLTILDLSSFDTSNVYYMNYMFSECEKLISLDLSNFETSNTLGMGCMFYHCKSLTSLDVSSFDTSHISYMSSMFDNCDKLVNLDLSNWNTSNAREMERMFVGCHKLETLDVSNFDTSNVTNMESMFQGCDNLIELDLSSFDTSNVTNMEYIFLDTDKLNTLKLGNNWEFLPNNRLEKSWLRDGDTTIYTAEELTNSYDGATMAGVYRAIVQLTIQEQVKGSIANTNKDFTFTINVIKNGNGINGNQSYTGSKTGNLRFTNGVATFTLKHNEYISINLNAGVEYTITQNPDGYTLSKTNDTGTLDDNKTASFIDTLNGTTPTGMLLNLIPYILILLFSIGGILLITKYKRI